MSYFNMVCDSCGREVYGCNIVNGMKFCAKCYQETFGETDKDKQIADLEAKLAELKQKAIVPKFKIGQEVFIIIQDVIRATSINSFRVFENNELSYYCKYVDGERMYLELDEEEIFATKEEAEQKLAETKGE